MGSHIRKDSEEKTEESGSFAILSAERFGKI